MIGTGQMALPVNKLEQMCLSDDMIHMYNDVIFVSAETNLGDD